MAQAAQVGAGLASQGTQAVRAAGGAQTMGAAATLAAVAGAVVMGPLTVRPLRSLTLSQPLLAHALAPQAVVAGAGAAYATTRGDDVGDIARATGKQAVTMVEKAKGARCGLACCVPMLTRPAQSSIARTTSPAARLPRRAPPQPRLWRLRRSTI